MHVVQAAQSVPVTAGQVAQYRCSTPYSAPGEAALGPIRPGMLLAVASTARNEKDIRSVLLRSQIAVLTTNEFEQSRKAVKTPQSHQETT